MNEVDGILLRLVPESQAKQGSAGEMPASKIAAELVASRLLIVVVLMLSLCAAGAYAMLAPKTYMAEAIVVSGENVNLPTSLAGQLGNLAGLAGLMTTPKEMQEALVVLRSRSLIGSFIEGRKLGPQLAEAQRRRFPWTSSADVRESTDYFLREVMSSFEDKRLGTVRVSIRWSDPVVAADWANALVNAVNQRMREDVLRETTKNSAYLRSLLNSTNVPTLQSSISRLLESELQKEMIARGREEYALKFVDAAKPPHKKYSPKRLQIVLGGAVLGLALAVLIVVGHYYLRGLAAAGTGSGHEQR